MGDDVSLRSFALRWLLGLGVRDLDRDEERCSPLREDVDDDRCDLSEGDFGRSRGDQVRLEFC